MRETTGLAPGTAASDRRQKVPRPRYAYKDRVFRMLFKEKASLLELYNAMNGTDYTDPEELTVTTLENAVYMGMKNDISFILDAQLNLYEHQSTKNENMPLRYLFYIADLYSGIVRHNSLYRTKMIRIPAPRFVVFYNGESSLPECMELRLSQAYTTKQEEPWLELKVQVLNINLGHNRELIQKCRTLGEYAQFTAKVREYGRQMSFPGAVEQAVDDCIQKGILADFLQKNRSEVLKVSIYEYDQEKHMRFLREDSFEEGYHAGVSAGRENFKLQYAKKLFHLGTLDDSRIMELLDIGREELESLKKMLAEPSYQK